MTSVLARGLRSPSIIILSLFFLTTLNYGSKKIMTKRELDTLPYAKQFADPSYLPGEWYLNLPGTPRRPFQLLLYPLVQLLPLAKVAIVARVLGYLFVSISLGLIARRTGLNAVSACMAIGVYLWLGQSFLPGSNAILKRTEALVAGYGLLFLAVHALMDRKLFLAAVYAGLATTFHVLVGGWGSLAVGLTVVSQRIGTLRQRIAALGLWCIAGCAGLYYVLAFLWEPEVDLPFNAGHIIVYFRNPHHLDPSIWEWPWEVVVAALALMLVTIKVALLHARRPEAVLVSRFALWALLPALCGFMVTPFSFAPQFLSLYPFRVGSTVLLVFGLIIGIPIAIRYLLLWIPHRSIRRRVRRVLFLGAATWFFWCAGQRFVDGDDSLRRFPEGATLSSSRSTRQLYYACHWIREHTEPGALLLTSPDVEEVSYLSRRPVVVRFKNDPSKKADIVEWYRRLIEFNGGTEPKQRGYDASAEIDRHFRELSASAYFDLARQYGATYLLLKQRDTVEGLRRIYKNDEWAVFDLRHTDTNGGG